jgi:IPT/TIG domain
MNIHSARRIYVVFSFLCYAVVGCKPSIDLDTGRTINPVNLPEITDIEPKGISLQTETTVTITGKNFVNVEQVSFDTTLASAFRVESPNRIVATFAQNPFWRSRNFRQVSIKGRPGTTTSERLIGFGEAISGRINIPEAKPPGGVYLYCKQGEQQMFVMSSNVQYPQNWVLSSSYYYLALSNLVSTEPTNGLLTVRPFLSGYTFTPAEQSITPELKPFGGFDFTGRKVNATETLEVSDIQPREGASNSGGERTGTDVTVSGKGFTRMQKVLVTVRYGNTGGSADQITFEEGTIVRIDSDKQMVIRVPRFDRKYAFSGRFYDCQIYLLREDTSVLGEQNIRVKYF